MSKKMITRGFRELVTTTLVGLLVACGGGGGDDVSSLNSESIVARGVITQLGSIWVLGVEYETPNGGSYSNDDELSSVADYKVGQWVRIRGRRNHDHVSGIADEVEYEAEIEGVALGGAINSVTIVITVNTNTAEATLAAGDALIDTNRYEVSGLWLDDSTIEATYIKDDDDGDGIDEVKGFVEAVNPGVSLTVHGVTYSYGGPIVVIEGDFVEIHFNGTTASKVELEDDFDDENEGQEAEYEGAVNLEPVDLASCPAGADFLIDRTCIDWDSMPSSGWRDGLTGPDDMVSGLRVEAEGHFNLAALFIAEEIKGRGNGVRIVSTAINVDGAAGTLELFFGDIQVTTMNGVTEYELDSLGASVNDISNTDGLKVRGIRTGPTSMLALHIKSESVDPDKYKLRAEVDLDGADATTNTITVMGISSLADADTELEFEDTAIASGDGNTSETDIDSLLNMIDDDNIISTTNGPRDVVEVSVDTTNGGVGSIGNPYSAAEIEIEEEDD